MKVCVLGGGQQGSVIANELASHANVTVIDSRPVLLPGIHVVNANLSDFGNSVELLRGFDLAVGALPARLGFLAARSAVEARTPLVDIAFYEEDATELHASALRAGVTVIPDCGLAPGISHLIVGRELASAPVDEIHIKVGGMAADRSRPFGYVITWSLPDLVEEYTRPARFVKSGAVQTAEPLTGIESVQIEALGTLEAFFTDGLRTLLTCDVPEMTEKTLRWPGHVSAVKPLLDQGRLADVLDQRCRSGEDLVVLIVDVVRNGKRKRYLMIDRPADGLTAMARTTALTCAAVARWMLVERPSLAGVIPPEVLGRDAGAYEAILTDLARHGIHLNVES